MRKRPVIEILKMGSICFSLIIISLTIVFLNVARAQFNDIISIPDAVKKKLIEDKVVPIDRIEITAVEGVVTLSGDVNNLREKERASDIARGVNGVKAVVNEIQVNPTTEVSDWQIREDVINALKKDPVTKAYQFDVSVLNSVVTLSGTVNSWLDYDLCDQTAKTIRGVKGLHNELSIAWGEKASDAEIKTNVEKTLEEDAYVDKIRIHVTVKNGTVILTGIVGSADEKRWADIDAHAYGAKAVDDSGLEVKIWSEGENLKTE
jgi:osmotically-inducible protein OsmY